MIKFTQEDFDKFEIDENGFRICPSGDYTEIREFNQRCSFGELCSFEGGRVQNGKYFACDRIGSKNRKTYFFIDENKKVFVRAGCFFGTEEEFIEELTKTHGGAKYEKHYIAAL